ncbi:MAG: response regulator [Lachnospiraceae bacterium]|nr:response regulator [Lachnospiraceae bacterium]MBR1848273.1 response regulator [Lachnospiraceae bacterium]
MMEWKLGDKAKKKQRILLVDDEELNRKLCERILIREGFSVFEAENGKEAVELMAKSPSGHFDLIVMDIQMPEMNGYEATKRIRSMDREDAKKIPIIALSANDTEEDIRLSKEYGMNDHMVKPFNIPKIVDVIRSYL